MFESVLLTKGSIQNKTVHHVQCICRQKWLLAPVSLDPYYVRNENQSNEKIPKHKGKNGNVHQQRLTLSETVSDAFLRPCVRGAVGMLGYAIHDLVQGRLGPAAAPCSLQHQQSSLDPG